MRLIEVKGTTLVIEEVDILDGTPLLDLKPNPGFDSYQMPPPDGLNILRRARNHSGRMTGPSDTKGGFCIKNIVKRDM